MKPDKVLSLIITILEIAAHIVAQTILQSPNVTSWGDWGPMELCPPQKYAQGFQLKVDDHNHLVNDTGLNAIHLFCGDPYRPPDETKVIGSTKGEFGHWGSVYNVYPDSYLTGFQLRVDAHQRHGDDSAANNIRFFTTRVTHPNSLGESGFLEGDGHPVGAWSQPQRCPSQSAICGIRTQVETYLRNNHGDFTELNNLRVMCCDYSLPEPPPQESTGDGPL